MNRHLGDRDTRLIAELLTVAAGSVLLESEVAALGNDEHDKRCQSRHMANDKTEIETCLMHRNASGSVREHVKNRALLEAAANE